METTAYDLIVSRLTDAGWDPRPNGPDKIRARCPGHDGGDRNLAVGRGRDGALLKCFSRDCTPADILAALGLDERDMFDNRKETTYSYLDGVTVHRGPGKRFTQTGPKGSRQADTKPLYVPPGLDLAQAIADGIPVALVEGEKDADTIWHHWHLPSVSGRSGASQFARTDVTPLAGAEVRVIPDQDDAGLSRWSDDVAEALAGVAAKVTWWAVAEGCKDATDHILAGHGAEALSQIRKGAEITSRLIPGGTFILDEPDDIPAIWGDGEDVLWAEGESLILAGPPGVGKTTLAAQVVRARILGGHVLDLPIKPTGSSIVYMAMDRPRQISRALRRTLGDIPRDILDKSLHFWKGPPLVDIARHPESLLGYAQMVGADTLVIDSIKDAAVGLSDDEVGAGYNRARQMALANGVEVIELHHVVKRGANGAAPNTLADLYGSVWITAGAGSVILLWGAAGDPIVKMGHLKQPASEVGPYQVIHDHDSGRSSIWHQIDLLRLARSKGTLGLTARDAATVMFDPNGAPSPAEVQKARRRLDQMVKSGQMVKIKGDASASSPDVYLSAVPEEKALTGTVLTPHAPPHAPDSGVTPPRSSKSPTSRAQDPPHAPPHAPHAPPPLTLSPPSLEGGSGGGSVASHRRCPECGLHFHSSKCSRSSNTT